MSRKAAELLATYTGSRWRYRFAYSKPLRYVMLTVATVAIVAAVTIVVFAIIPASGHSAHRVAEIGFALAASSLAIAGILPRVTKSFVEIDEVAAIVETSGTFKAEVFVMQRYGISDPLVEIALEANRPQIGQHRTATQDQQRQNPACEH